MSRWQVGRKHTKVERGRGGGDVNQRGDRREMANPATL